MATERETLTNRRRGGKLIDMEKVYRQLDSGRTVTDVAKEWGVSVSTLHRKHKRYQEELKLVKHMAYNDELPPLPEDLRNWKEGERK